MLIQEINALGRPRRDAEGKPITRDVDPVLWFRMQQHWGKRLRWAEVKTAKTTKVAEKQKVKQDEGE